MMVEHAAAELFGLAGTFPRPGWVVLDAARDHRFTGELEFDTDPTVRVYFDRGRIYHAERVGDPTLGSLLVGAGALSHAQLEHGSILLGDVEHLGRLFERVPSLDRHAVLAARELLNDQCISWLAAQHVSAVHQTPYRHHPSGTHHWDRPDDALDLTPGDPLPAPAPSAAPVVATAPEPLFAPPETFDDDVIQWDEPSWLDTPDNGRRGRDVPPDAAPTAPRPAGAQPAPPAAAAPPAPPAPPTSSASSASMAAPDDLSALSISTDWIDRLESEGLPAMGADPLARPTQLPPLAVEPLDRFEVIWPSGEVDEQFGATEVATIDDHHPDLDRPGPTARVATPTRQRVEPTPEPETSEPVVSEPAATQPIATDPVAPLDVRRPAAADSGAAPLAPLDAPAVAPDEPGDEVGDEVVLAVRRAVASIETGALAARRRLTEPPADDPSRGTERTLPGRVAVRLEQVELGGVSGLRPPARSVFDDPMPAPTAPDTSPADAAPEQAPDDDPADRGGALRRLIGSLRRR